MTNRVWPHRDPASHASGQAALQPPRTGVPESHEVQALHAEVEAYREARNRDRRELAAWRDGLRGLVQQIAPLALHNRLREQPDFQETALPADWLAIADQALSELRAQLRRAEHPAPRPATPAGPQPGTRGWRRQPATPPLADASPTPPQPESMPAPAPEPEPPATPDSEPTPAVWEPEGPGNQGTEGPETAAADAEPGTQPECPHQGTPWFRHWQGTGSLADNIERVRAHLRQWGVHDKPTVPDSIAWRGGDTWVREMALLCLMAETGMAPTRQLALALTRLAGIGDPFKRAGAQNMDLQSLNSKQLIATTQLQAATGKGAPVPLNVAWLTEHGRSLIAEHTVVKPVESEWQRLDRMHGGEHQLKHNSRVMLAAAGFRTWGWDVAVLPEVEGAEPDLLVTAPGLELAWPVEVEAGSGSEDRRHAKWRAVAGLDPDDPRLCLIAPEPHSLLRMAKEIRQSAPKARLLCGDLRSSFRLPSSLAAARDLPLPLLHFGPRDRLQPLNVRARDAAAAAKLRP